MLNSLKLCLSNILEFFLKPYNIFLFFYSLIKSKKNFSKKNFSKNRFTKVDENYFIYIFPLINFFIILASISLFLNREEIRIDQNLINESINGIHKGQDFLCISSELDKFRQIYDNQCCMSLNLRESLEFFKAEKLTFFANSDPFSVYFPLNKKVRLFFIALDSFSTLYIPKINIEIHVIPGQIKYIDLNFSELGKLTGIIDLNLCSGNYNPIFFKVIRYPDFLRHKNSINRIIPVIYKDVISRYYANP